LIPPIRERPRTRASRRAALRPRSAVHETLRHLAEITEQLRRIADGHERIADRLDHAAAQHHRELMRMLGDVLAQLDKIERTQYG
jgi:hypothetical protein